MKLVNLCLLSALSLGAPLYASAQQSGASDAASDSKYCSTLASAYRKVWPALEAMPVADTVLLDRCNTDPRGTIAALLPKLADQKIEVPQNPGVAQVLNKQ